MDGFGGVSFPFGLYIIDYNRNRMFIICPSYLLIAASIQKRHANYSTRHFSNLQSFVHSTITLHQSISSFEAGPVSRATPWETARHRPAIQTRPAEVPFPRRHCYWRGSGTRPPGYPTETHYWRRMSGCYGRRGFYHTCPRWPGTCGRRANRGREGRPPKRQWRQRAARWGNWARIRSGQPELGGLEHCWEELMPAVKWLWPGSNSEVVLVPRH